MSRAVVVIGASSGIGRAAAQRFAARGDRLLLTARGEYGLNSAAEECRRAGASDVHVLVADVIDAAAVQRIADIARHEFGTVDVVVQAAGVMAYGRVEELPTTVFARVIDTFVDGTAHVARAFLPIFRAQGHGTLILVNSVLGSIAVPGLGAYVTAKWAQLGLARILQLETRDARDVHVCVVAPGAVATPIYRRAANYDGRPGNPPPPVYSADRLGSAIVRAADHPRRYRSVGFANQLMVIGFRLAPWAYDRLVGPLADLVIFGKQRAAPTDGNVFTPDDEWGPDGPAPSGVMQTADQHF